MLCAAQHVKEKPDVFDRLLKKSALHQSLGNILSRLSRFVTHKWRLNDQVLRGKASARFLSTLFHPRSATRQVWPHLPPDPIMQTPNPEALAARTALFDAMVQRASATTVPLFRSRLAVDDKGASTGRFDPVTEADRACERALRSLIESAFPDDGILGEEYGGQRLDAPFCWIIDPVDGTRAFVAGMPLWGTLVGVLHRGRPVAGLAAQPFIGERFVSTVGGPRWQWRAEDRPLATRSCTALAEAQLMTTTPALFDARERPAYDAVERACRAVRYGTDWYAYALIAAGCVDVVVESGLAAYDILPLVPLIEAAGGHVTDWSGAPLSLGESFTGQVLALGDPALGEQVLPLLAPAARAATG